jgi:hypothetical protein
MTSVMLFGPSFTIAHAVDASGWSTRCTLPGVGMISEGRVTCWECRTLEFPDYPITVPHRSAPVLVGDELVHRTWYRWECACGTTSPPNTFWSHSELALAMGLQHAERTPR